MKNGIHPEFFEAKVICTGRQRDIAAGGRIEKFNKRYAK